MLKCECNEKHARLECEPLPNGLTLVRVYEDEQEVTREAVSNMDTPWHGYSYTTYETVTQVPDGRVDVDASPIGHLVATQLDELKMEDLEQLAIDMGLTVQDGAKRADLIAQISAEPVKVPNVRK